MLHILLSSADAVKAERGALLQKNKEQLKKEARELNLKVNYRVNGTSCDAPKEIIVARLLEKKMLQLHPSLAATEVQPEAAIASNKITINDKFCLINVIFSSELADTALTSEQTITHAELDAGLVGHNSPFWKMVESRFNTGFQPDGVDGITHADLIHHTRMMKRLTLEFTVSLLQKNYGLSGRIYNLNMTR